RAPAQSPSITVFGAKSLICSICARLLIVKLARNRHYRSDHMATVGEQLRQAREKQKLTVQNVSEKTKIRTDHISALEEGNFDVFSAPVYIRGFVRSYAG